ncbi:MAG TPA: hypothetical protein VMQ60_05150 [Acidobacteriaceae bacterium]|jgi:hypothetical protein|nr:hypothetical protein [Acidobacteriaceae bacterium]
MTQLDVLYSYGAAPSEQVLFALSKVRDVYGVRLVEMREADKTVRVEYDASRLNSAVIHQLLRRAGLDILEPVADVAQPKEIADAARG